MDFERYKQPSEEVKNLLKKANSLTYDEITRLCELAPVSIMLFPDETIPLSSEQVSVFIKHTNEMGFDLLVSVRKVNFSEEQLAWLAENRPELLKDLFK